MPALYVEVRAFEALHRCRKPLVEILLSHRERLVWCLRLGLRKLAVIALVDGDAVTPNIHEKEAAVRETVVHLVQRVDDEIDRRAQRFRDRQLAIEPLLGLYPILNPVRQAIVVDDDQKVEVGLIGLRRVRLVDPSAASIRAVEDDLEDAALFLPILGRKRAGLLEFLEQDLHYALELALFCGRKMIEVSAHRLFVPVSWG